MTPPPIIAGVDISSHLLAIVYLDARNGNLYETLELKLKPGGKHPDMPRNAAFSIAARDLSRCGAVFLEEGMGGRVLAVALGNRAMGALITHIAPETAVSLYKPGEWKVAAGLKGNADKPAIHEHARRLFPELDIFTSQDLCDAACIAHAGFAESLKAASA